jgi:uncharacterized membrane protein YeaQ/YmgE (transglycosylase-associated protein family)
MFSLIGWLIYGTVVGIFAKLLSTYFVKVDNDLSGWGGTILIGVIGSYAGGGINLLLGNTNSFSPAGIVWGIVGGVVTIVFYYSYLNKE